MPTPATVYDILISCPGDVSQFIDKLENAINKFNNFFGRENRVVLRPVSWMNNAFPQFGSHPQKVLHDYPISSCLLKGEAEAHATTVLANN